MNGNNMNSISVYTTPRPRRVAFIIDPDVSSEDQIDAIFNFNLTQWGGRLNPIIPKCNSTISDDYWQLLSFCDPDIIYSFIELEQDLINKIDRYISPSHFIYHKDYPSGKPLVSLHGDQVDTRWIINGLKKSPSTYHDNPAMLVNHCSIQWKYYRNFYRNFGIYDDRIISNKIPPNLRYITMDNDPSPVEYFKQIADERGVVFPIQLSGLYSNFQEILNTNKYDNFCVVVGENIWDWIYYWNRIFLLSKWKRNQVSQICIPKSFIESDKIIDSLKLFLSSLLYRTTTQPPCVQVVSHEIVEEDLIQLSKNLVKGIDASSKVIQLVKNHYPKIEYRVPGLEIKESTQHSHVTGNEFYIQNPYPILNRNDTSFGVYPAQGKIFMIDLKIQYRPERFFYTNIDYWWILPKRLGISRLFADRRVGRILKNGLISIEIRENDKNFKLKIPDDMSVIRSLLIGDNRPFYGNDIRKTSKAFEYGDLTIGDKGQYAVGFIKLFSSLWHACEFVNNRYWRNIVLSLCQRNIEEDNKKLSPIINKLNKKIPSFVKNFTQDRDKNIRWLARYILNQAREQKIIKPEISFDKLLKKVKDERNELVATHNQNDNTVQGEEQYIEELLESLSDLTNNLVFIQGIKPRCRVCGSSFWYNSEEIELKIFCKGCNSIILLPVESKWIYRLNELIKNAVSFHGVIPVIWAMGKILSKSRSSFISIPGIKLLKDYKTKDPLAEIDIVCINDGELIICEIKTSVDEFSVSEINKLATICKNIIPDKVIIGAFNGSLSELEKFKNKLSGDLIQFDIDVETIIPDSQIFQPSYYI